MKRLLFVSCLAFGLVACSTTDRYNAIATSCQTYAVALNTAASLNSAGKLSPDTVKKIDATVAPARGICSGTAPTDDPKAVQKISDAVIAVLTAQKEAN